MKERLKVIFFFLTDNTIAVNVGRTRIRLTGWQLEANSGRVGE